MSINPFGGLLWYMYYSFFLDVIGVQKFALADLQWRPFTSSNVTQDYRLQQITDNQFVFNIQLKQFCQRSNKSPTSENICSVYFVLIVQTRCHHACKRPSSMSLWLILSELCKIGVVCFFYNFVSSLKSTRNNWYFSQNYDDLSNIIVSKDTGDESDSSSKRREPGHVIVYKDILPH